AWDDIVRSAQVGRLAADRSIGGKDDLLDLHLGLGKLLLAVALEQRAALVGRNRLVQLHLAALELLDDGLQLLQRVLERQAGDVLGNRGFFGWVFGHRACLLKGLADAITPEW